MPEPLSRREIALDAVATVLKAGLPDITVVRTPSYALTAQDLPYVVVQDGEDQIEAMAANRIDIRTSCGVVVGVRCSTRETIGTVLNALVARVRKVLAASPTLGGEVIWAEFRGAEEPIFQLEAGGGPEGQMALNYEIWRVEDERDPYVRSA